ncbi:MAG: hypothetical protein M1817_003233 [Caeruleum heppii]|nr:MAG: hypothetical protein M1817_003233 [Caeruleum heppii]
MADGYARLTSRPQCVIVHVDVGTLGLGAAIHNCSTGRAPVLIFAGLSPYTLNGELRGSRTEYIHWVQDVPDQKAIVAQYCRYVGEIKTGRNVKEMVGRAYQFMMSDPKGPVYLLGAREVMEEEIEPYELRVEHWGAVGLGALPQDAVESITRMLVEAEEPLVVTGYCGRNHATPRELVTLANAITGLRVLDTGGSDMSFPASHPGWLGLRYGNDESIRTADVILVLDCDVPWVNTQCHPKPSARIIHIDVDPLKSMMPVFYIAAEARYRADSCTAIRQLYEHLRSSDSLMEEIYAPHFSSRWETLQKAYHQRLSSLRALAVPHPDGISITTSHLTSLLRSQLPKDTIFALEAVTNTVLVADQLRPERPGSWINCGGGGLGWSGGAPLGIKLASMCEDAKEGKGNFVCAIVGDGTFLFGVPGSVFWIARRYGIGVLTVVLNNDGWRAPLRSALLVHPSGLSSTATPSELNISFGPTCPDYGGIARAAAGGSEGPDGRDSWLWTAKVRTVDDLTTMLPLAIQAVDEGRGAVLDVLVAPPVVAS